MKVLRGLAIAVGVLLGLFFVARAVVELLTIDYSNPSSQADDWGGPSLAGVLLVHCGLGVVSAVAFVYGWRRLKARRKPDITDGIDPDSSPPTE